MDAGEITLSFTANHNNTHVKIDSIFIENITQGADKMLYGDDTLLTLVITHIDILEGLYNDLYVSQNYPNPFLSETNIDVYVPVADFFSLDVYDLTGRKLTSYGSVLQPGMHHFTFHACNLQNYFLTVGSEKYKQQRIMIQIGMAGRYSSKITYNGISMQMKTGRYGRSDTGFPFNLGDELKFTGYSTGNYGNVGYDTIIDTPTTDRDYVFDIIYPVYLLTLLADPEYGGAVDGEGEYEEGEEVNISATAAEGYKFIGWTDETGMVISEDASFDYTMPAEDITLTANFEETEIPVYTLTLLVEPEGSGTVEGDGEYVEVEKVIISAEANEGWEFIEWTGDTEHVDNPGSATAIVTMPAENITLTANFEIGEGYIIDIEGNIYKTVIIGDYEWMAENLRTATYNNGAEIPNVTDNGEWSNLTNGAYCWYFNQIYYGEIFGALYNWYAVETDKLCPEGWRVPTDEEWKNLEGSVDSQYGVGDPEWNKTGWRGYDVGDKLKSTTGWEEGGNGTDDYDFTALPGGFRNFTGVFMNINWFGFWWSSTEHNDPNSWNRGLRYDVSTSGRDNYYKKAGFSVRCLTDI